MFEEELEEILDYTNSGEYDRAKRVLSRMRWTKDEWAHFYNSIITNDQEIFNQEIDEYMIEHDEDMMDEDEYNSYNKIERKYINRNRFHKFVIEMISEPNGPVYYDGKNILKDTFFNLKGVNSLRYILPYNRNLRHISENLYIYKVYDILRNVFPNSEEYKEKFKKYNNLSDNELFSGSPVNRKKINRLFYINERCMEILIRKKVIEGYENLNEFMNKCGSNRDFDEDEMNIVPIKKRHRENDKDIIPKRRKY